MGKLKLNERNEQKEKLVDSIVSSIGGALKEDVEEINIFELDTIEQNTEDGEGGALALRVDGGEGANAPAVADELPIRKIRYAFVCVAVVLIFFAVVGVVNSAGFVSQRIDDIVSRRELKDEFALFIFPVVINDPPAFESVVNLQDTTVITIAIWQIMLMEDKSHYEADMGVVYIPEADVERAARSLFGTGSLNHHSLSARGISFIYSADEKNYQVPENLPPPSYSPLITEVTNVGETYTVTVDYMMPNPFVIAGFERENEPIKTMIYTITRTRERMSIDSIQIGEFAA
jgi:hypothetical protein